MQELQLKTRGKLDQSHCKTIRACLFATISTEMHQINSFQNNFEEFICYTLNT